jgi:hypothetical protein
MNLDSAREVDSAAGGDDSQPLAEWTESVPLVEVSEYAEENGLPRVVQVLPAVGSEDTPRDSQDQRFELEGYPLASLSVAVKVTPDFAGAVARWTVTPPHGCHSRRRIHHADPP